MYFSTSKTLALATLVAGSVSTYAPVSTSCPRGSLVRSANGLSDSEEVYGIIRKVKADAALSKWLLKTKSGFDVACEMPKIALTSSGGGYRALLSGAGVVQALDNRDSDVSTSGLYQALSYHSGLSGGSWLLSSIIANDFPTISTLLTKFWKTAFANGLFDPLGDAEAIFAAITQDLALKEAKGFRGTVADVWSRLLSYQLLPGANGGVDNLLSQVPSKSQFIAHKVPYPIILAQHVDLSGSSCIPPANAPMWEFTPYEMGSWDKSIASFALTKYLGTSLSAGKPTTSTCITAYENLGFILGTSSSLFNDPGIGTDAPEPLIANFCQLTVPIPTTPLSIELSTNIGNLPANISTLQLASPADLFATWPNPFYNLSSAPLVSSQQNLAMVDGGESGQINPVFPMLQPERDISIILVSDNTDGNLNYPSGKELHATYLAAQAAGLTRMPFVPESSVLLSRNLTSGPLFFGCANPTTATIVWIPNYSATSAGGNTSTSQVQYEVSQTLSVVANGKAVMSQNDSDAWATCLGCAIMEDTGSSLPTACTACFAKYCFKP